MAWSRIECVCGYVALVWCFVWFVLVVWTCCWHTLGYHRSLCHARTALVIYHLCSCSVNMMLAVFTPVAKTLRISWLDGKWTPTCNDETTTDIMWLQANVRLGVTLNNSWSWIQVWCMWSFLYAYRCRLNGCCNIRLGADLSKCPLSVQTQGCVMLLLQCYLNANFTDVHCNHRCLTVVT